MCRKTSWIFFSFACYRFSFFFKKKEKKETLSIDSKYQFRDRLHSDDADWKLLRKSAPYAAKYRICWKQWMFFLVCECLSCSEMMMYFFKPKQDTVVVFNGESTVHLSMCSTVGVEQMKSNSQNSQNLKGIVEIIDFKIELNPLISFSSSFCVVVRCATSWLISHTSFAFIERIRNFGFLIWNLWCLARMHYETKHNICLCYQSLATGPEGVVSYWIVL